MTETRKDSGLYTYNDRAESLVSKRDKIDIASMIAAEMECIIEDSLDRVSRRAQQEREGLREWADEECARVTEHAEDVVRQEAMNVAAMMAGGIARAA